MIDLTYKQRIAAAGVETIRTWATDRAGRQIVLLSYNGDQVRRPHVPDDAIELIRERWGLDV